MTGDIDWGYVQHLLVCRAGPLCECCGRPFQPGVREANIHHRRTRAAGGTRRGDVHSLSNLLLLCAGFTRRLGGVNGCHGLVTTDPAAVDATGRGLTVPQGVDLTLAPVVLFSGRRVLLDPISPFYLTPGDGLAEWVPVTLPPDTPHPRTA